MTENNYTPPNIEKIEEPNNSGLLASRWDRLGASLLDCIISACVILPLIYFTVGLDQVFQSIKLSLVANLCLGVLGVIVFALLHGKLLISNGQTIGKKIVGIKIVDLNGNLPTLKEHLLKRYAFFFIPGQIPVIGTYISTINVLFIFRDDKRCLHDLVAGTKVVNC